MPTYVYKCSCCGKVIELEQSYNVEEREEVKCRECRESMERVWQPVHFHFRGSGWYKTDAVSSQKG